MTTDKAAPAAAQPEQQGNARDEVWAFENRGVRMFFATKELALLYNISPASERGVVFAVPVTQANQRMFSWLHAAMSGKEQGK